MNEWTNDWMNEWMNEWMREWMHERIDHYMNAGLMNEWTDIKAKDIKKS